MMELTDLFNYSVTKAFAYLFLVICSLKGAEHIKNMSGGNDP